MTRYNAAVCRGDFTLGTACRRCERCAEQLTLLRDVWVGMNDYKIGDRVEKYTGDYQLTGEVRAVFTTRRGKVRYVVEHDPGFLLIYSRANLRRVADAE